MILEPILADADAILAAWHRGGRRGGRSLREVRPDGKLGHSWPRSMSQIPINIGPNGEPPSQTPLFPYGFGLSYRKGT